MKNTDPLKGKIREVEYQVLDQFHFNNALFCRGELEAVSHLLKIYGDIIRDFYSPELLSRSTDSWLTEANLWTRALYQSLCWIFEKCDKRSQFSKDPFIEIDQEAMSLLKWSRNYCKLSDDHIAASRGFYKASCNETKKEIRFHIENEHELTMLTNQLASWPIHSSDFQTKLPKDQLNILFLNWLSRIDLTKLKNHEGIPEFGYKKDDVEVQSVIQWAKSTILPELDGKQKLAGFSLNQFRVFWGYLTIECKLLTQLEDYVDKEIGRGSDLGSVMYQLPAVELASYFSQRYGLAQSVVEAIIDCLTFDSKSSKSNLMNSPLVKTSCGTISMLCRRVVTCNPHLLICSALAKRSNKRVYDSIINEIERYNVKSVAELLHAAGFTILVQKRLQNQKGECICPDLIVYEPESKRVLILDYKHAIPPLGAAEVSNRLRDLDEWTEQIRRYLRFASNNQTLLTSNLGIDRISQCNGMLLFRWPFAVPGSIPEDVTFGDWPSFSVSVKNADGMTIKDILLFYRLPRDSDQKLRLWQVDEEKIQVGDWTYIRPLIVSQNDHILKF